MRRALAAALALLATAQAPPPAADRIAANPNASPEAQKVLTLLRGLPARESSKLMTGQYAGATNANHIAGDSFDTRYIREVAERGGKYAAILATDYVGRDRRNDPNCRRIAFDQNAELKDQWRNGGLVLVRARLHLPRNHGGDACGLTARDYDLRRILPGGADRAKWLAMLDEVAVGLRDLADQGIVVLFNPLDGAGEGGFWWGGGDPALYRAVWRDLFDYFGGPKQLFNLLWVYDGRASHYPGHAFVDVITEARKPGAGSELYRFATEGDTPKPYGFWHIAPADAPATPGLDYVAFLRATTTATPRAAFFVSGLDADRIGSTRNRNQRDMTYDPLVLDRDEIQLHAYLEGRVRR